MRKVILHAMTLIFVALGSVYAEKTMTVSRPGDLALGLGIGSPTGLSMKYWINRTHALDGGLGFPFDSDVKFSLHGDYLWQIPIPAQVPGDLPFYVGFGGRLRAIDKPKYSQKVEFGARIPVGIEFMPSKIPLDVFAELAPVVVFTPNGEVDLDGQFGLRYRFGTGR